MPEAVDQRDISKALHNLTITQERELQNLNVPQSISMSRRTLFDWFKQRPNFSQIYKEATKYYLIPLTDRQTESLRGRLVGSIVGNLAYFVTIVRQPVGQILFSHERTFEFYHVLYPHAPIIRNPMAGFSLKGIPVPDGIIVEKDQAGEKIVAVCEYTATAEPIYYQTKLRGFNFVKDRHPEILAEAGLVFTTPQFDNPQNIHLSVPGAGFEEMPFKPGQLREFINGICANYSPFEGDATLADLQVRARAQLEQPRNPGIPEYQNYVRSITSLRGALIEVIGA